MGMVAAHGTNPEVTLAGMREAHGALAGVAVRTRLVEAAPLAAAGTAVFLKCEQDQQSGSFKLRGAYTAVRRRLAAGGARGVITYSSGNHGQAVAFAAQRLQIRAVIVMPENAPPVKVRGVARWGGEAVFAGTTSEERRARALELAEESELTVIPPFDDRDVVEGQGTVGLEIAEQCPTVRHVVVPAGGGGLASGVTAALGEVSPQARVTVVEPEGAPTVATALAAGKPVRLEHTASVADGLLPLEVGALPLRLLIAGGVSAVQVSDDAIRRATLWLADELGLKVEPSGAATTAAVLEGAVRLAGPTVLVVSGGNVDPQVVDAWR
jgi:threonine dehydratase